MMPPDRHGGGASAAFLRLVNSACGYTAAQGTGGVAGPAADCFYDNRALLDAALSYSHFSGDLRRAIDLWKVCRGSSFLQAYPQHSGILACLPQIRSSLGVPLASYRVIDVWKVCRGSSFLQAYPEDSGILACLPQIRSSLGVPPVSASYRMQQDAEVHWALSPGMITRPKEAQEMNVFAFGMIIENTAGNQSAVYMLQTALRDLAPNPPKGILGYSVAVSETSDAYPHGDNGVVVLGVAAWLRKRHSPASPPRVCEDEGWTFMKERYYNPAWKNLDSSLRSMGFAPQGPISRLFALLLAYSAASHAFKDAAIGLKWIKENVHCNPAQNKEELKACLRRFVCNFFKAVSDDGAGWAPVMLERD